MKKVRDFLRRINAPELNAAVQQVKATPTLLADFQQAVNFVALSVTPLKQNQRNIGAINRQQQPRREGTTISFDTQSTALSITDITRVARGRGNRGRGGRFVRGARGGRIGQRGNGRGGRVSTGYYSPNDWAQLTREQQERILTQHGTKRNVSAISVMGNEYEYKYYDDGSYYDAEQFQQGSIDGNPTANNATQQESAIALGEQSMSGGSAGNEFGQRSRARYQNDDRYIGMFTSSQRHTSESQSADTNSSIHNISKIHTTRETMMSHCDDILDPQLDQGFSGGFRVLRLLTFS